MQQERVGRGFHPLPKQCPATEPDYSMTEKSEHPLVPEDENLKPYQQPTTHEQDRLGLEAFYSCPFYDLSIVLKASSGERPHRQHF